MKKLPESVLHIPMVEKEDAYSIHVILTPELPFLDAIYKTLNMLGQFKLISVLF